jgi:membrane-associated phospholipid phosphatase
VYGTVDRAAVILSRAARGGFVWVGLAALGGSELVVPTAVRVWAADGLAVGLSYLIGSERPCGDGAALVDCPDSPSFPSNHAASAFAGAVTLARHDRRLGVLLLPAAAIAASRVRVGVHRPRDVIAGAALGIAVGTYDVHERG